jgi:pSer/pThr/pTyr-binding forkhead associated (FHA) protein
LPPPGGRPAPPGTPPPSAGPTEDRPLYLFFEGNWYTVDQEQFVIGRGSKFSDLPIKDANISRRHCAVVRRNGEYYIKDLGSTNGIEFAGERVDDHHVEEGNVYYLCDHELRFSFAAPY